MTDFSRIKSIFLKACELKPSEREAFVRDVAAGDEALRQAVEELLQSDRAPAAAVLAAERGAAAGALLQHAGEAARPATPASIGGFAIVGMLGEGGMGIVYEAQQHEPSRRVALKVIRSAVATAALRRRFQREIQALGQLRHPGIAQIFQAGEDLVDGRPVPFFAMELVRGAPLLKFAAEQRLSIPNRVQLALKVCEALQHAHESGVCHRDLKSGNILVDRSAGDPQPKLLDFGVARFPNAEVTQQTSAGELVGTIAYMSPEQAMGDPHIDARSDVYSLGAVVYELLTGALPHPVNGLLPHEAIRMISEEEPAPAGVIAPGLRGDVETILAKALEKDPRRRYASASDFAADLRRYLREQPIAARPASALYRVRKFARRNKPLVAGVMVVFLAMLFGTLLAVRQAALAERARAEEHHLRDVAERMGYRAALIASAAALQTHGVYEARRNLELAPARLRGWEWEHLRSRLDDSLVTHATGFVPMRLGVAQAGGMTVTCNSGGVIHLWRNAEFAESQRVSIYSALRERRISGFAFSSDAAELRVDTRAGAIWLTTDTLQPARQDKLPAPMRSPSGRYGLFADPPGTPSRLILRECGVGRDIATFEAPDPYGVVACFSEDDRWLAIQLPAGLLEVSAGSGEEIFHRPDLADLTTMAFDAGGTRLAVGQAKGDAAVLDVADGRARVVLNGHASAITVIQFSRDGRRIATASNDRTLRFWRAGDGAQLSAMRGAEGRVTDMAFTSGDEALITISSDKTIRRWDARAEGDPFVWRTPAAVYDLAISPDGSTLAAACLGGDRPLRLWDLERRCERGAALDGYVSSVAYSRHGPWLAVGRSQGPTEILRASDLSPLSKFNGQSWRTDQVLFDFDGQRLLCLGNRGKLVARDLHGATLGTRQFPAKSTGEGCRAALSPDGALLAVASGTKIFLLDATNWETLATLEGHTASVYALAFSASGERMVSGGADRTLRVWDVVSRTALATLEGHSDEIFAACFSPDGRRLVSGGRDRVIRVWDAEHFEQLTQLHGHESFVYCLEFTPDGRTLVSGGGDATVRFWSTTPYREWRAGVDSASATSEK